MAVAGDPLEQGRSLGNEDVDTQAILDEVLSVFRRRLVSLDSPLVEDPAVFREVSDQVRSIIKDVLEFDGPHDALRVQSITQADPDPLLSIEVGTSRARRGVHPVESLRAAAELFNVALPTIVRHYGLQGLEILDISQRLHRSIMNRIAFASLPYVEFLLTKIHSSGEKERHRISRELHDSVGHGMALAQQHFDLHRYYTGIDKSRAEREYRAGQTSLSEALRTVQHLSTELRRSVGEGGIKVAIESYLQDNITGGIEASLAITGDAKLLPPPISQELYLIMREACRNALRHGQPSEIRLTIAITELEVTAEVSDNGRGFSVGAPDTPVGGGLLSMAERVELLDGTLRVESVIGEGVTVTARVPLSGGAP